MPAVEILERQRVVRGCRRIARRGRLDARGWPHIAKEPDHAQAERQHRPCEHGQKHRDQQVVRKQPVEVALQVATPQRAIQGQGQHQKQAQAGSQAQRHCQPVALVQGPQRLGPSVAAVSCLTHLGHGPGDVDGEFVRWCVLAGVQASSAVVAQIGQVMHVSLCEVEPTGHGREYRAKAFAIATGVADRHLARDFVFRAGRYLTGRQGAGVLHQGFKRCHVRSPACAGCRHRAASRPAMRPNVVPIDMPTPAV